MLTKNRTMMVMAILPLLAMDVRAGVMEYGDRDLLGTGTYPTDPTAGATLQGLAPGAITVASGSFRHVFPFTPSSTYFPGTDRIYANGAATPQHDGYTGTTVTADGPQVLSM